MKNYPIRNTVRIVLINDKDQLLLMHIDDPNTHAINEKYAGCFWVTIGGQQESGETVIDTALRELTEETGIQKSNIKFGPIIWLRELDLVLYGKPVHLKEQYVLAYTNINVVNPTNLTEYESKIVKNLRWFTVEDIANSEETIYPTNLERLLEDILLNNIPIKPLKIK